ncbi:hypothetical protein AYK26_06050 [Euryarchaeota archaeon SM23-78]|nr:MAG: hypothetical protein AYK26_06050 [Euryarchaeota archaeon SM23-78]
MAEMLIVKAKIKEVAKECNVGGDVAEALSNFAHEIIKKAAERAKANDRKTIQGKDIYVGEKKAEGEMLIVKSKIKDVAEGFNVGGDVADALNQKVTWQLMQACERAKANGRKTVQARDV